MSDWMQAAKRAYETNKAWQSDRNDAVKRASVSAALAEWAAIPMPERREATGERSAVAGDGFVMPFGRDKGKRLSELDVRSLRWWEGVFARDVDDEAKEKFREQNRNRLEQVRARLRELGEAGDW